MNHTFRTINRYHEQFESYKGVITPKSFVFWLSIISIVLFVYSFFWYMDTNLLPISSLEKNYRIFVVMLFEVISLICWFKLQRMRNILVIQSTNNLLKTSETDVINLKKIWIEKTLGVPRSKFIDLAADIDRLLDLRDRNKSPLSFDGKTLLSFIFTIESKNRVLAMFMGGCAAIMGLSISGGASVDDMFYFFEGATMYSILLVLIITSIFLMLTFLVIWYLLLVSATLLGSVFDRLDGLNSSSNRRARIFIGQLIVLHELPKGRVNNT